MPLDEHLCIIMNIIMNKSNFGSDNDGFKGLELAYFAIFSLPGECEISDMLITLAALLFSQM